MSKILGIDLGTSTSEVAVLERKKPKLLSNKFNEKITPSVVGIDEDGNKIVGKDAKDQFLIKPKDTVLEVKRLMGTNKMIPLGDEEYKPEEISSYILKHLKNIGKSYLGEDVKGAVITVPAYFTDEQRKTTVKAGKLAGLEVERIINEPTAAALAYGINNMEDESHILVYDLGGGTLDVTILEMFDGVLDVKASSGNNELGGKDFDKILMDDIVTTFQRENNLSLEKNIHVLSKLKKAAEECKIALSEKSEHTIEIPFIAEVNKKPIALKRNITRKYFEDLIYDLVKSSILPVKRALRDAKVKKEDIDKVLLVGGSTRIPLVKKLLNETLKKDILSLVNPDYAVSMGAAIQGGIINNEFSSKEDIIITDVCPYSLGIETLGYVDGMPMPDVLDILIPRNTSIPVIKEEVYTTAFDFQEKVEIKVYQGDKKRASHNNFLATFMLTDIPPAPMGEEKIKVKFMYDINGLLQVKATILSNNKDAGITIEASGIEDKNSVDIDKWSESKKSRRYKRLINKAEKIIKTLDESFIKYEIEDVLKELKTAIVLEKETETIKEISERLSDILYDLKEE